MAEYFENLERGLDSFENAVETSLAISTLGKVQEFLQRYDELSSDHLCEYLHMLTEEDRAGQRNDAPNDDRIIARTFTSQMAMRCSLELTGHPELARAQALVKEYQERYPAQRNISYYIDELSLTLRRSRVARKQGTGLSSNDIPGPD